MVSVDDFLVLYDDFSDVDIPKIQAILEFVERNYCPAKQWGRRRVDGIMLLAAHILIARMQQTAEIVGMAATLAEGQVGRSPTALENDFTTTVYGRQYLSMRRFLPTITGFAI